MEYSHVLPSTYKEQCRQWLLEDAPSFDYGGFVVGSAPTEAILYCKSPGVLAGVPFFSGVFDHVGCSVDWRANEGEFINGSSTNRVEVAVVKGPAR